MINPAHVTAAALPLAGLTAWQALVHEFVSSCGVDEVIDYTTQDFATQAKEIDVGETGIPPARSSSPWPEPCLIIS